MTVTKATRRLSSLQLGAVWEYRELLYFMVWRDVKVSYKQTALGVFWVALQSILSTIVFTVIFGIFLDVPSNGLPYPIFAFACLLPWQYFASSLTRTSTNLVDNANLITKVYFPRLTIPLSWVLTRGARPPRPWQNTTANGDSEWRRRSVVHCELSCKSVS